MSDPLLPVLFRLPLREPASLASLLKSKFWGRIGTTCKNRGSKCNGWCKCTIMTSVFENKNINFSTLD